MQLELLVPRAWRHPSKVFLDGWYRRLGYHVIRTANVADAYPELAPMLATPCEFLIYEKPLASRGCGAKKRARGTTGTLGGRDRS
jgi:hypothetical protein